MKERTRKRLFLWARIVIALAAIAYIIIKFDIKKAWEVLTNPYPELFWVAMAMVAFLVFMGFLALRWYILSRARKHPYGFFYLYRSVLIHMLFNNVLPTTIGGDVYRVMDTGGHEGRGVAFSIVWTDRMVGFIAVFGFGFIASIPYTIMNRDFIFSILFGGMFLVAIFLTLAFLSKKLNQWIAPWLSKIRIFKYPLGEKFANAFTSITHYRKHKGALVAALFSSLGVQLSIVLIWFFLFLALPETQEIARDDVRSLEIHDTGNDPAISPEALADSTGINLPSAHSSDSAVHSLPTFKPNFIHFTVTIPAVNTAAMFSVGGWGLREATFVDILSSFTGDTELSTEEKTALEDRLKDRYLATALLFDAVNIFFGLLGGLFLLFRRSRKKE